MPFCPECEYKYPPGVEVCPDCATPLVETLEAGDGYLCDECKERVADEASWCPNCGTIFIDTLRCFLHPDAPAYGRCVVCGQHVCPQCAEKQMGRYFCRHDAQAEEQPTDKSGDMPIHDWEAELYMRHLKRAGVASRLFSQAHDRRLCFEGDVGGVKLVAPFAAKQTVAQVLRERDIHLDVVLFECERCSGISRMSDPVCPNCGR
jgi:RNA polymerase subunit RPABC4/transcription elongation factor Spt4